MLQDPTSETEPTLERWLDKYRNAPPGDYAALYLAEPARRIDSRTIDGLLNLALAETTLDDRSRLRVALALHGPITRLSREKRSLKSSIVGEEALWRVALLATRGPSQSDPANPAKEESVSGYIRRILMLLCHDLELDTPDLISKWAATARQDNADRHAASAARWLLSGVLDGTKTVWDQMVQEFNGGDDSVKSAIAESFIIAIHPENQPKAFDCAVLLPELSGLESLNIRILPLTPCGVIEAVKRAKEQGGDTTPPALSELLHDHFAENPLQNPQTHVSDSLMFLEDRWFPCNPYDSKTNLWELAESAPPDAVRILVHWLNYLLERSPSDNAFYEQRKWIMFVLSLLAAREPETFRREAGEDLAARLREAAHVNSAIVTRAAAIRLLGKIEPVDEATIQTLLYAMKAEAPLRDVARGVLDNLHKPPADEAIERLIETVRGGSASTAAAAASVLANTAQAWPYPTSRRKELLEKWAAACGDAQADRGVYEFSGVGQGEDDPYRIEYRGPLRNMFDEALLKATGGV